CSLHNGMRMGRHAQRRNGSLSVVQRIRPTLTSHVSSIVAFQPWRGSFLHLRLLSSGPGGDYLETNVPQKALTLHMRGSVIEAPHHALGFFCAESYFYPSFRHLCALDSSPGGARLRL